MFLWVLRVSVFFMKLCFSAYKTNELHMTSINNCNTCGGSKKFPHFKICYLGSYSRREVHSFFVDILCKVPVRILRNIEGGSKNFEKYFSMTLRFPAYRSTIDSI